MSLFKEMFGDENAAPDVDTPTDDKPVAKKPAKADKPAEDKPEGEGEKRKFVAVVLDDEGGQTEKNVKAFSISDIEAFYGKKFVSAELHPDETGEEPDAPTDDMPADDEEGDEPSPKKEPKVAADPDAGLGESRKYKNLLVKLSEIAAPKSVINEMAKRIAPAKFYDMAVAKYGKMNAGALSWSQIKKIADENDVLIPAYIRDNKIMRGLWNAKPKDMEAPAHEPTHAGKEEPKAPSKDAVARTVSRMASDALAKSTPKEEPKAKKEPKKEVDHAPTPEKKEAYDKADFPEVEFLWTTSYREQKDLYNAIEKHHGVDRSDTESLRISKAVGSSRFGSLYQYYIVKKGTHDVLGSWTMTGLDKVPGRGMVSYGEGHITMSKKAQKNRDDNMYGFLVKPQHGSAFISVGTHNSHGPWDKFSAEAHVNDKYQHFEYDDDFGHGTISVVKVKKVSGKWERA